MYLSDDPGRERRWRRAALEAVAGVISTFGLLVLAGMIVAALLDRFGPTGAEGWVGPALPAVAGLASLAVGAFCFWRSYHRDL